MEQAFTATVISVETAYGCAVALSDIENGETVHGVYIAAPADGVAREVELEFNDQGNACNGTQFSVQVDGTAVRIAFDKNAGMFSGRIGFDPLDESFPDEREDYELPLAALVIEPGWVKSRGRKLLPHSPLWPGLACRSTSAAPDYVTNNEG